MKILTVSYLPRGERSHTRKLLEAFQSAATGATHVTLDLLRDTPELFTSERLAAYIQRNYLGATLSPAEAARMAGMDRMAAQLVAADAVVLAFPMHNFSFPAPVKAWFDAVMLKGVTWDVTPQGYAGLLQGRKALVLMASGGVYSNAPYTAYEHALSLAKVEFGFMGFSDVRTVTAAGVNMFPDRAAVIVEQACDEARQVAREWLGGAPR